MNNALVEIGNDNDIGGLTAKLLIKYNSECLKICLLTIGRIISDLVFTAWFNLRFKSRLGASFLDITQNLNIFQF